MLTLVNTNNYFGQHEFHITGIDINAAKIIIGNAKWFKKPKVVFEETTLVIFCFTNYDKATVERIF